MGIIKKITGAAGLLRAKRLTNKANRLLSRGEHNDARTLYLQLEEMGFVNYMIYHNIGTIYFEENDFDKAEEYFSKAARSNPGSILSYSLLSEIYLRKKEWNKAEQTMEKALEAEPYNYFLKKRKNKVFNKEWRKSYVKSLEKTEEGAAAQKDKRNTEALGHYSDAVGADPKNALAHFLYGSLLFNEGEKEKGLEHLSIAVEIEPANKQYGSVLTAYQNRMKENKGGVN